MKTKPNKGICCCQTERGTLEGEQGMKTLLTTCTKMETKTLQTAYYQARKQWGWTRGTYLPCIGPQSEIQHHIKAWATTAQHLFFKM